MSLKVPPPGAASPTAAICMSAPSGVLTQIVEVRSGADETLSGSGPPRVNVIAPACEAASKVATANASAYRYRRKLITESSGAGTKPAPSRSQADMTRGLRSRLDHRVRREETLIHRTHVDVPTFALRSLKAREVAHRGEATLYVSRDRTYFELALEWIDRDARVGHRAIAIGRPPDVIQPELIFP